MRRKGITFKQILKWFFIGLVCAVLLAGIAERIHHFFSVHIK
ncbi:hypothetical protein Echvi_4479 [Echinicola vietnamensis DSM 17526]|uniref:Uncharacterized protein n=1 Tax=Echinicola vietnamensis (strain DSM 17526 / LMG 23754 / KMM 6221) TaxID=926556 RepID=L0G5T4_ECHVK|nr:hypothetical protein Echvi_4479 [Echinicola vietnamensis DSM 17526]